MKGKQKSDNKAAKAEKAYAEAEQRRLSEQQQAVAAEQQRLFAQSKQREAELASSLAAQRNQQQSSLSSTTADVSLLKALLQQTQQAVTNQQTQFLQDKEFTKQQIAQQQLAYTQQANNIKAYQGQQQKQLSLIQGLRDKANIQANEEIRDQTQQLTERVGSRRNLSALRKARGYARTAQGSVTRGG